MILLLFSLQDIINYTIPNLLVGRRGSLLDYSQFDREVNVSRSVCQSFCLWGEGCIPACNGQGVGVFQHAKGGVCLWVQGGVHPRADTPWTHTPWENTPNWADIPLGRHSSGHIPPGQTPTTGQKHT